MSVGRRKAREDGLQILYQKDLNSQLTPEGALSQFENFFTKNKSMDEFTQRIVLGVCKEMKTVDEILGKHSQNWRPDRMAAVDRNILRIGIYELHYCDDIPATVTINEMVELAKAFGAEHSPGFINGVLDMVAKELNRPGKAP